MVRLGKMSECLMNEDARQYRVKDYSVGASPGFGGGEQGNGPLGDAPDLLLQTLRCGEITLAAYTEANLLDIAVATGNG